MPAGLSSRPTSRPAPSAVDPPADLVTVVALLRRIDAKLDRLLAPSPCATDDVALVVAIAASIGSRVFASDELLAHAAVDETLRAALERTTPRRLGKRLRRLIDRDVAGFTLRRIKRFWVLQVTSDLQRLTSGQDGEAAR
jgi:hypothetical protein